MSLSVRDCIRIVSDSLARDDDDDVLVDDGKQDGCDDDNDDADNINSITDCYKCVHACFCLFVC